MNNNDRVYGLDILRAFAILSVLYAHSLDFITDSSILQYLNIIRFDGVQYFFVLSGFLIGSIMIKSFSSSFNLTDIYTFWIRRWFRTLPNYYLFLLLLILVYSEYKWRIFKFMFFVQGFYKPQADFFNESWSLAVEEWFYLLFPILLFAFSRLFKLRIKNTVLYLSLSLIFLTPIVRYSYHLNFIIKDELSWDYYIRQITILRFDSIIMGVVGAYINYYHSKFWIKVKNYSFILGLIVIMIFKLIEVLYPNVLWNNKFGLIYMSVFHFTVLSFCILLLLPYLSQLRINKVSFIVKVVTKISLISYSVYLLNYSFVKNFLIAKLNFYLIQVFTPEITVVLNIIIFYIITIGLALFLYPYFELPLMNLRDRFKTKKL